VAWVRGSAPEGEFDANVSIAVVPLQIITWLIYMCDMTRLYDMTRPQEWHVCWSYVVASSMHVSDMTHCNACDCKWFICVTCNAYEKWFICDMQWFICKWCDCKWFICKWFICDMQCMWLKPHALQCDCKWFICVTWLVKMSDMY